MKFSYKALDAAGVPEQGDIDANDHRVVIDMLNRKGLIPIDVRPSQSGIVAALNKPVFDGNALNSRQLRDMTNKIATLLDAGLTLERSLMVLSVMSSDKKLQRVLNKLLNSIREGSSLAVSMQAQGSSFPDFYISMIKAGEAGGTLDIILGRLANYLDQAVEVSEKIRSALIYPALLMLMILITLTLLVTLILPQFETIFQQAESQLPAATYLVMKAGSFINQNGIALLAAITALTVFSLVIIKQDSVQNMLDKKVLSLPVIGKFRAQRDFALLHRMIGILLQSGIPLTSAFQISQKAVSNRYIQEKLSSIISRLREGSSLSAEYLKVSFVPPLAIELTRVGESTGQLGSMLLKTADIMDADTEQLINRMMALLVPLLTIGMGLFIAAIIGSVLIGIMSLNDLAF
jgi:general secretion pathway protein F